jgi:large subunit ribosomal protein L11
MKVKLLVEGGNMTPGPAVAQQLGPMGINLGKVIGDVNSATSSFKGTKVPVELNIDPATKEVIITVSSPPVSELLKKELKIEKASGDHKKIKAGNIAIEQIISIAKTKFPDALENDIKAMVKSITGTCVSLGVLVDSKSAAQVCDEIESGEYDKEINGEKTEVTEEKRKQLEEFFSKIKSAQDAQLKVEEEQKAAKEEKEQKKADAVPEAKPAAKPGKK